MHLYDCKVRLNGSVTNEVFKTDVTAAEVMLLRAIHGDDAVVNIVETSSAKRSHEEERERLQNYYVSPRENNPEQLAKKRAMFRDLFGHDSVPLPIELPASQVSGMAPEKPKRKMAEEKAFA